MKEFKDTLSTLESETMTLQYSKDLAKFHRKDYEEYNELVKEINL